MEGQNARVLSPLGFRYLDASLLTPASGGVTELEAEEMEQGRSQCSHTCPGPMPRCLWDFSSALEWGSACCHALRFMPCLGLQQLCPCLAGAESWCTLQGPTPSTSGRSYSGLVSPCAQVGTVEIPLGHREKSFPGGPITGQQEEPHL